VPWPRTFFRPCVRATGMRMCVCVCVCVFVCACACVSSDRRTGRKEGSDPNYTRDVRMCVCVSVMCVCATNAYIL